MAYRSEYTPSLFYDTITSLRVRGYKSLVDAELIVRPLTLLAGANSSGKSSIIQPLLLLKQTMSVPYKIGAGVLLSGEHVKINSASEIASLIKGVNREGFAITVYSTSSSREQWIELTYNFDKEGGVTLTRQSGNDGRFEMKLELGLTSPNILKQFLPDDRKRWKQYIQPLSVETSAFGIVFNVYSQYDEEGGRNATGFGGQLESALHRLAHLPGWRGLPQRSYPRAVMQLGRGIQGTFAPYTAGTIQHWESKKDISRLRALNNALKALGLTGSIAAEMMNANEIEVRVGRLPTASKTGKDDLVNIADVGLGVSQVLPIVVALIAAESGQIVYIEQPELHLHPKAQVAMAHLLADAAKRGVRVIAETHSSLILLTVQTLVAEGKLTPEEVGLHWFERDAKGATKVTLAEVDENGSYGEWPADFGDIELKAHGDYLDAVVDRNIKKAQ